MKLTGIGSTSRTTAAGRTTKAGAAKGTGFGKLFEAGAADGEFGISDVGEAGAVASVDGLFALQEVPDAISGGRSKGRARQRGETILDKLEELRHGLLTGSISEAKLHDLVRLVDQREPSEDPKLAAILDEIELRAKVELAKLERGRETDR